MKFLATLYAILLAVATERVFALPAGNANGHGANPYPFSPGFNVPSIVTEGEHIASHSWEFGTLSEALLELFNSSYSVFGPRPFPVPKLNKADVPSLAYADSVIVIGTGQNSLADGDGAVGDPLSLGVSAVLLGKTDSKYAAAAKVGIDYAINGAPRYWNGAISHRADHPELWADFVYMAPPFLAYYAADTKNATLLLESVKQCRDYRQVLQANDTTPPAVQGAWHHIIHPANISGTTDLGLWSTGNAWAAAGMTRVLATVIKAPVAGPWRGQAIHDLTQYIREIVDGVQGAGLNDGMVRNYINDQTAEHGYGELSGTSLIASTIFRMAVLQPQVFAAPKYLNWADNVRKTLGGVDANGNPHVTADGIITPTVNPLNWQDTQPFTSGSPEGQSFGILLYSAWRDCVLTGICRKN